MCVFNFRKKFEIILFESNYKAIVCSLLISSWLKNFSVLHNAHCGFSAKEIDFRVEFERRQQRIIIISCLVVEHLRSPSRRGGGLRPRGQGQVTKTILHPHIFNPKKQPTLNRKRALKIDVKQIFY